VHLGVVAVHVVQIIGREQRRVEFFGDL